MPTPPDGASRYGPQVPVSGSVPESVPGTVPESVPETVSGTLRSRRPPATHVGRRSVMKAY
jgi:hypothetical protein